MPMRAQTKPAQALPTLTTSRLDHMPIVAQVLKRLRVADLINEIVPADPRSHVTTGQCVEALVLAILTGTHTLSRVDQVLGQYDLETIMGWRDDEGSPAARLHDVRLGHSLVAVYKHGRAIQAAVTIAAIRAFELELKRLHLDGSTVMTYGAYKASQEPDDQEDMLAVPHVTYGHSKDHRPDLKQIMFGLAVTGDGGVPVCGRASSGNRADALESRFAIARLAEVLPDPKGSTLVGDSKLFAGATLLLARRYGFHYLTVMPHTVGIREEALSALRKAKASSHGLPLLKDQVSDRDGALETWRGVSVDLVYQYEAESGEDATKIVTPIPMRCLAIESSSLRERKRETLSRRKQKELETLERASKKLRKRTLSCDHDAETAAKHVIADTKPRFHKVVPNLCAWNRPVKRARGRPRKDDTPRFERVWSSSLQIEEDSARFEAELDRESCFVLATDRPRTGPDGLSDTEALQLYKEEFKVEGCFKSSKGPLEIAPVFLKTPKRLAGLALVYIIALTVRALIQRETRARLAAAKTTIPGNDGPTNQPTTEVVFRLMERLSSIRPDSPATPVIVTGMTTEQAKLLRILANDLLDRPSLKIQTPTIPVRGQRGYVPPELRTGGKGRGRRHPIPRM